MSIVAALVAIPILMHRVDEEIRSQVQARLVEYYYDLDVHVRSAQLIEGEGIVIRGLSFSERSVEGPPSELAYFEEIILSCPTDWQDLALGELAVSHVTVRRPKIRAIRTADGGWSTQKLLPLPKFNETAPTVTIENGILELFDSHNGDPREYVLREINLELRPGESAADDGQPRRWFEGSVSGDFLDRIELKGWHDPQSQRWSMAGSVDSLELSPELRASLPTEIAERLSLLGSLRGDVSLSFRVDHDPDQAAPLDFDVRGRLERGRLDDRRLPYPLTDVAATFHLNREGVQIESATARSGRTTLRAACVLQGYEPGSPLSLTADAERLVLDRQLVDVLPPDYRQVWYKHLPAGEVNARLKLEYDGQNWSPQFEIECLNVSFTHHKFPYRLQRGSGNLVLRDRRLKLGITAYSHNVPVRLDGEFFNPGPRMVGQLTVSANGLPLDDKLFDALPGKGPQIVRALSPRGTINAYVRTRRDHPNGKWVPHIAVDLNGISTTYEKFPYPLRDVRGRLEAIGDTWHFRDLVGINDSAYITCSGQYVKSEQGGDLYLRINGTDVALSEELRDALSPRMQDMWRRIKPRGSIDLTSEIRHQTGNPRATVTVRADLAGDGVAIEPEFFPYAIDHLRGVVFFREGRVDFQGMQGVHGRTRVAADGHCDIHSNGSWRLQFAKLTADRVLLDRELLMALPPPMRTALAKLNPSMPLNLDGAVGFTHSGQPGTRLRSDWDVTVATVQSRLNVGIDLENLGGSVRLTGDFDGRRFQSHGWIDVDSVTYNDFQLTDVQGPIWIGNDRVLLGAYARPGASGQAARRMTAGFYGGRLEADVSVLLERTPKFLLQAQLTDGDLARFANETLHGAERLTGKVAGQLQLQGTGGSTHTLTGGGIIRVRDGNVYELPLVVSLLKILSIRAPDRKAFSTSDIDFRIQGEHIYFDHINLYGDAVSLLGKGEMNFDKQVRMVFHGIVGRDKIQLPLLRPVLGAASRQLMLIYVDGPLDNPRTTREALPGVKRAVEEIGGLRNEPPAEQPFYRSATDFFQSLIPGRD